MWQELLQVEWISELIEEVVEDVPSLILRTITLFVTVLLVVRMTGKRSVAHLAPWDLALVILIGEVAAIPVADLKVHLTHGVLPVLLIGLMHLGLTTINLHWNRFETWTEGGATHLVQDGKVLKQNLIKERVSMIDLESALRNKEVTDLSTVKEARLEPSGGISVILRDRDAPATPADMEKAMERILNQHMDRTRKELTELLKRHGKR